MAQSFIPEKTCIICTNMTCGTPLEIMQYREKAYTIHKAKDKPLLTIIDKKLSASFECVVPGIHWGGLQALCLGIAVACLVIATVATGGAAAAIVGAALAVGTVACGVGIASGITALCTIAHACDITTEASSAWEYPHKTVLIERKKALLNRSIMKCGQGGVLNLIMDPAIAKVAATTISDHNMNQFYIQMGSQFAMGFIGTIVNTGNPIGLCVSSVLAIPAYFWGEDSIVTPVDDDFEEYEAHLKGALTNTGQSVATDYLGRVAEHSVKEAAQEQGTRAATGEFVEEVWETGVEDVFTGGIRANKPLMGLVDDAAGFAWSIRGGFTYLKGRITGDIASQLEGAIFMGVKGSAFWNFSSFLVNLGIAIGSDMAENEQEKKAIRASLEANKMDANNGTSVVAVNQ